MEEFTQTFIDINLTLFIIALILLLFLWSKSKTLYFVPFFVYLINSICLYIFQGFFYIPSDLGRIWSILSRTYEVIVLLGVLIVLTNEKIQGIRDEKRNANR